MTNSIFWKRFAQGKVKTHISSVQVRLPSPKEILSWSQRRLPNSTIIGQVDNAHTVEHDSLNPVAGGLFCERIFGPITTNVCACLKKKGCNEDYCKICEVQFTQSRLRRYQMGHIALAAPLVHIWALQGGYLGNLLGKKNVGVRALIYGKVLSQSKVCMADGLQGYKRSNALPFSNFVLFKPDSFTRIYQYFHFQFSGGQAETFLPLPFYAACDKRKEERYTNKHGRTLNCTPFSKGMGLGTGPQKGMETQPPMFRSPLTLPSQPASGAAGHAGLASPFQKEWDDGFGLRSNHLKGIESKNHEPFWKDNNRLVWGFFKKHNQRNKLCVRFTFNNRDYNQGLQGLQADLFATGSRAGGKRISLSLFPTSHHTKHGAPGKPRIKHVFHNYYIERNSFLPLLVPLYPERVRGKASPLSFVRSKVDALGFAFNHVGPTNGLLRQHPVSLLLPGDKVNHVRPIGGEGNGVACYPPYKPASYPLYPKGVPAVGDQVNKTPIATRKQLFSKPAMPYTGSVVLLQVFKRLNIVLLDQLVTWKRKKTQFHLAESLVTSSLPVKQLKKNRLARSRLAKIKIVLVRRKRLIQSFLRTKQLPEWMILSVLPVLPPSLRPILELEPGNVVVSDLNGLYQTVLRRNEALVNLLTFRALEIDIVTKQVALQQAVERLFDKGAGTKKRPIKSLSGGFHGKKGLFRLHLLGKRVDYSGRSVIVVGPQFQLHECGLPKEMALVLFLPFLIARLKSRRIVNSTGQAKQLVLRKDKQIWNHLKALIYEHPVLLNRAPTLHRLGFQAFQPLLVSGKAMVLSALVCTGFNADFDGDQMAVHVPLSYAARAESWKLLYARNNMLSPATGKPIVVLSQEMILGCYWLGLTNQRASGSTHPFPFFSHVQDVHRALQQMQIGLQTAVWLRLSGFQKHEDNSSLEEPLELRLGFTGHCVRVYGQSQKHFSFQQMHSYETQALRASLAKQVPPYPLPLWGTGTGGKKQAKGHLVTKAQQLPGLLYIRTTAGRIQLNETVFSH